MTHARVMRFFLFAVLTPAWACAPVTQLSTAERCATGLPCAAPGQAPALALLRDVIPQTIPNTSEGGPTWGVLPDGHVLFVSGGRVVLVNQLGEVTKVFTPVGGHEMGDLVATDPRGGVAVLRRAVVDLRTNAVRGVPEGDEYRACSRSVDRCVRVRDAADGDAMDLRIDPMMSTPTPREIRAHRADLLSGERLTPFGEGQALTQLIHDVHLGASVIGLCGADGERFFACTLDVASGRVLGCRRNIDSRPAFVWMDASSEKATLAFGSTVELVLTRSEALAAVSHIEGTLVPSNADYGFAYVRIGEVVARVHLETLARVGPPLAPDVTRVAVGEGSASLRGNTVVFFGVDGRELGQATLGASAPSAPWLLDTGRLITWEPDSGLLRVRPGDANARFTGPLLEVATAVNVVSNHLQLIFGTGEAVEIGELGMHSVAAEESDPPEYREARRRVESIFASRPSVLARLTMNRTPSDAAYAYIEAGKAHVTRADGSDLVPPIDVPASYGDACRLSFLTNMDLILQCREPFAAARIRFREGRLDAIDYSGSSHSTRGDFVALVQRDITYILNRHSGETITTLRLPLGHGAVGRVYVSRRGDRLKVEEMTGFFVVDLSAPDHPVYRWTYGNGREGSYDVEDDTVISCTPDHELSVLQPFASEPAMLLPFAGCAGVTGARWRRLSGFVAELGADGLRIVRLRDGHHLEIRLVSTASAFAMMVVRSGEVLAAFPESSPLLRVRRRDSDGVEHLSPLPRFPRSVSEHVAEFFAQSVASPLQER